MNKEKPESFSDNFGVKLQKSYKLFTSCTKTFPSLQTSEAPLVVFKIQLSWKAKCREQEDVKLQSQSNSLSNSHVFADYL